LVISGERIVMTGDKETEQRRLAEWKAHLLSLTPDASTLMETLRRQHQEAWQSYVRTVAQEGTIEGDTFDTIHRTAYSLFPGRKTKDIINLLDQMLNMVRQELGKESRLGE